MILQTGRGPLSDHVFRQPQTRKKDRKTHDIKTATYSVRETPYGVVATITAPKRSRFVEERRIGRTEEIAVERLRNALAVEFGFHGRLTRG